MESSIAESSLSSADPACCALLACFALPPCGSSSQPALTHEHAHVAGESFTQQNSNVALADLNLTACPDAKQHSQIWLCFEPAAVCCACLQLHVIRHNGLLCTAICFGACCEYTQSVQCSLSRPKSACRQHTHEDHAVMTAALWGLQPRLHCLAVGLSRQC